MSKPPDSRPTVSRIAELQQLITALAGVKRMVNLTDTGRPENDAEHSFGLALTCWFLAPVVAPELDMAKIFSYALAHDIVEVHAGDTFVFADEEFKAGKPEREQAAIQKLTEAWPDFPALTDAAQGYKDRRDEEAKFVKAVDKLLPPIMINLGEKSDFWHRHKVTLTRESGEKAKSLAISKYI